MNVGKTIESSKKRVTWRLKVEEGNEYEISLTHSLASGKKVLRVDGIVKYSTKGLSLGDWDYVFNLPHGHVVHIIIKPSVDLNDMYDLIIDGVSFRRLPEDFDELQSSKPSQAQPITATKRDSHPVPPTYHYSESESRNSSRDSSFIPWECPRCTLVNEKPLAPVCEACGSPKPAYISPEARDRALRALEEPTPAPARHRTDSWTSDDDGAHSRTNGPSNDPEQSDFFNPFEVSGGTDTNLSQQRIDPFATGPVFFESSGFEAQDATAEDRNQDITSMLNGLDFSNPAPVQPLPAPTMDTHLSETRLTPTETRMPSDDLWGSDMVSLDLKPHEKKPHEKKPSTAMPENAQSLEQARQMQAGKERTPVMPTYGAQLSNGYSQGTSSGSMAVGGMQPVAYSTAPFPQQGYPIHMGPNVGAPASQTAFMTYMQPTGGQHGCSSDPFATLS